MCVVPARVLWYADRCYKAGVNTLPCTYPGDVEVEENVEEGCLVDAWVCYTKAGGSM